MTLFERFHAAETPQNHGHSAEPELLMSLRVYLQAALNNRLNAGAVEYTKAYQRCLPALMNIRAQTMWPLIAKYLLIMDSRLKIILLSPPQTLTNAALFVLECELKSGEHFKYQCDFLENGALVLESIEND